VYAPAPNKQEMVGVLGENKTTSVTTHVKSASSSSKADTLNFYVKTAGCDSYFKQ